MDNHRCNYKNDGKDEREMRRQRSNAIAELRKEKRQEAVSQGRNVSESSSSTSIGTGDGYNMFSLIDLALAANHGQTIEERSAAAEILRRLIIEKSPLIEQLHKNCEGLLPLGCVVDLEILMSYFPTVLLHNNVELRIKALIMLKDFAASNETQRQMIFDAGLAPLIIENLSNVVFTVREKAAWVMLHLTSSNAQVSALIQAGIIPPLCALLTCNDEGVLITVLSVFNTMSLRFANEVARQLENCGATERVKNLTLHENIGIRIAASQLVNFNFPCEEKTTEQVNDETDCMDFE